MGLEGTSTLFSAVGSGVEAYGDYSAGVAKAGAYDMAAGEVAISEQMRLEEITTGGEELASTQQAMYAKAGVRQSGSVLDVMLESATNVEFDKIIEKWNMETQINSLKLQGKTAYNQGLYKAGQAIGGLGQSLLKSSGTGKVPTTAEGGPAGTLTMG